MGKNGVNTTAAGKLLGLFHVMNDQGQALARKADLLVPT